MFRRKSCKHSIGKILKHGCDWTKDDQIQWLIKGKQKTMLHEAIIVQLYNIFCL